MRTIAFFKNKGGAGATTAVANLAAEIDHMGKRVWCLDLDPARHLAAWANLGEGLLSRVVQGFDGEPVALKERLAELRQAKTDLVLLDCPPGYLDAGLAAVLLADLAVIPSTPSPLDLLALRDAVRLVRAVRRGGRPVLALLPARVTPTGLGRDLVEALGAEGLPVLPPIRQRVEVAKASMDGMTCREVARSSASTAEFTALARAILEIAR